MKFRPFRMSEVYQLYLVSRFVNRTKTQVNWDACPDAKWNIRTTSRHKPIHSGIQCHMVPYVWCVIRPWRFFNKIYRPTCGPKPTSPRIVACEMVSWYPKKLCLEAQITCFPVDSVDQFNFFPTPPAPGCLRGFFEMLSNALRNLPSPFSSEIFGICAQALTKASPNAQLQPGGSATSWKSIDH